jgi:hypothetical protein
VFSLLKAAAARAPPPSWDRDNRVTAPSKARIVLR